VDLDPSQLAADDDESLINFDVGRYLIALRKYFWAVIAIVALAVTGAVVYTQRQPKIYEAKASVQIEPKRPDLLGQHDDGLGHEIVGGNDYYAQQQAILGSYSLIKQTVEQYHLYTRLLSMDERKDMKIEDQVAATIKKLQEEISIKYPNENRIMYVVVRYTDPKLAADIANAQVQTYVEYSKGLLVTDNKQATGALSEQFDEAESKLRDAEAALFKFQQDNDLLAVSIEAKQNLASSGITAYSAKLNDAHARRIELQAKLERMEKAANEDVLTSPILLLGDSAAAFEGLRNRYYEERNKFIEMEKEIGPKNTSYQMQKAKIDDLYSALETEAKRMLNSLQEQVQASLETEAALHAEIDRAQRDALALGPTIVKYNELLRTKQSFEDRYNILRTRLSTSELSERTALKYDPNNVLPLDPALVPLQPVSPSMRLNVITAVVIGIVMGLALIFLIVFLDRSIKSTEDAQQAAGASVLGIIPIIDDLPNDERARDLYVAKQPTSRAAECCRSLRTNIMFSAADREMKTIVVSSANPREGKTTSVIYLGTAMAQSGQRVLLIDTDMRRPRLHESLGIPRQNGLSNLILGDHDYDDVIKTTDIPNLFVLPCGPLPPNPAELLMTRRFSTVLEELGKRFDRIILDSPPLQLVTDAVVLSKLAHVDGVIMVVQAGKTLRDDVKRSARHLTTVGGSIIGLIVNELQLDNRSGYYYAYYGYGQKADPPKAQA
jgi:polysaccharide biosynthesis transport protein